MHDRMRPPACADALHTAAVLAGFGLLLLPAAPVVAGERWYLLSRHGECAEIASLRRKLPDLGDIADPEAFVAYMRRQGHAVTTAPIDLPKGRAQEVTVPSQGLALVFVTTAVCTAAAR